MGLIPGWWTKIVARKSQFWLHVGTVSLTCFSLLLLLCMCAKSLQSCLTLCDPMDWYSPPGSSVHGVSKQECWVRLPCPPLGHIPDPGIKHESRVFPALTGRFFTAITTHNHNNGQPQRTPPFNLTVRLRSFVQLTGRWPDQPTCECLQEITTEGQLSWRCFARLRPLLLYFLTISLSPAFFFLTLLPHLPHLCSIKQAGIQMPNKMVILSH